jgi:hypothetical protein
VQEPASAAASTARLEPADWLSYEDVIGLPTPDQRRMLPDFLVVSPPRTATTWLDANLRGHWNIVIPPEKEVRYFDRAWRDRSLEWYCRRFARGPDQLAADISPSYALLPDLAIKHIRALKPDLKIVVLLRDLQTRAWSHLKHARFHGEANFAGRAGSVETVGLDDAIRNLVDDYSLSTSDYEGTLRRWLKWFPKEQFHVAFFEEAVAAPDQYFAALIAFLGIDSGSRRAFFVLPKMNQSEDSQPPPDVAPWLDKVYAERRKRVEQYLMQTFALTPPWPRLPPEPGNAGPTLLPDRVDGRAVELDKGMFWYVEDGGPLPDGPTSSTARPAQFMADLLRMSNPEHFAADAKLRQSGVSLEDLRLIHELDRMAEIEANRAFHGKDGGTVEFVAILEANTQRILSLEATLAERSQRLESLENTLEERSNRLLTLERLVEQRSRAVMPLSGSWRAFRRRMKLTAAGWRSALARR